ncbi:MAG: hypothetical protein EBT13_15930 [Rhodobacteraceae bacterium]|nr:hypothetical protein [Paracoccaceae bacterium]
MDDAQIERVARRICQAHGFDPDEVVTGGYESDMTRAEIEDRALVFDAMWDMERWRTFRREAADALAIKQALEGE